MQMIIKISIIFILLTGFIGAGLLVTQIGGEISYFYIDYAVDVTNDRALVGFADNVFIGKVIAQTGNKPNTPRPEAGDTPGFSPQTQFSVEVLENIKGNLTGTITVSQQGGYERRIIIVKQLVLGVGDKLLEPDKTYLFITGYNEIDGWHAISAPSYGNLPIANQTDYQNKRERFKTAFSQEISPEEWRRKSFVGDGQLEILSVNPEIDFFPLEGFDDKSEGMFIALNGNIPDVKECLKDIVIKKETPPSIFYVDDNLNLVVFRGVFHSGGFSVNIDRVEKQGNTFTVYATYMDPGDVGVIAAFTQPVAIIPMGKLIEGDYEARLKVTRIINNEGGSEVIETDKELSILTFNISQQSLIHKILDNYESAISSEKYIISSGIKME